MDRKYLIFKERGVMGIQIQKQGLSRDVRAKIWLGKKKRVLKTFIYVGIKLHLNIAFKILHSFAHNSLFSSWKYLAILIYFPPLFACTTNLSNAISQHLFYNMLLDVILFWFMFHHFNFRSPGSHQTLIDLFVCLMNIKLKITSLW